MERLSPIAAPLLLSLAVSNPVSLPVPLAPTVPVSVASSHVSGPVSLPLSVPLTGTAAAARHHRLRAPQEVVDPHVVVVLRHKKKNLYMHGSPEILKTNSLEHARQAHDSGSSV